MLHPDVVHGGVITKTHGVARPTSRDAGIDREHCSTQAEAQNPFDSAAVEPSGRSAVPSPSTAPYMRKFGIDIACRHVRLHLIALHRRSRGSAIDRVEHTKQLACLITVAERRKCQDRPCGSMGILAAVFTDARQISFDVPRVLGRLIKRRGKYQYQPFRQPHQVVVDCGHGPRSTGWFSGTTEDSPGLNNGVNAALLVFGRAERRAIIEEGPAIPLSVPTFALESGFQRADMQPPGFGALVLTARIRNLGELPQNRVQEPAQPNALALALLAYAVHPIVPVAGADQRKTVATDSEASVQRSGAMFKEGCACL